ncbi:MAG TPA: hypothetical protein P5531_10945 [Bacteroidales bacterium]|nr:hypothetical protein [Bacteroidales bacterium]HSA44079.1 hypothetical protein [Bacteroidales bacterium]
MSKISSTLIVLLLAAMSLQAQTHKIEYYYCVDDPPVHKILYKVGFKDLRTYELVKLINLEQGNPFAQPCLEFRTSYEPGLFWSYKNNGCFLSDLVPANIIKRQRIEHLADQVPVGASIHTYPLRGDNEFAYYTNLRVNFGYDALIAVCSKFYLYNIDGTLRCKIEDSDVEINDGYLTTGGRYLMHRFGDYRSDAENNVPGFRIIDLETMKYVEMLVIANSSIFNMKIDSMVFLGMCENSILGQELTTTIYIFDMTKNKCYTKDYTGTLLLDKFKKDCVVWDDNRTDYYEKDYRGEDLLWRTWNMDAGQ